MTEIVKDDIGMNPTIKERIEQIRQGIVPEGYKKTSIGIIAQEWKVSTLGNQLYKIKGGGTPKRKYKHYYNGDIPWATVKDIGEENFKSTTFEYITREGLENSSANLIESENLIVSTRMALGSCFINKVDMAINQDLKGLYPNKTKVDLLYLMYWYRSQSKFIKRLGVGSTVKGIDLTTLKNLPIIKPPLSEQQQIADILSTWDRAIELKEFFIKEKEEQKKGLMRYFFFEKYVEQTKKLSELSFITMGQSPESKYYNQDKVGLPLIQGNADIKGRKTVPRIHTSEITKTCSPGDILLTVRAPVGKVAISKHEACIGRGVSVIKSNNKLDSYYLYYYLIFSEQKWIKFSQGSTFDSINSSDIKNFPIVYVDLCKQKSIAEILSTADKEISLLKQEVEQLKEQKKGLMQLLLTGIVRVGEVEELE